MRGSVGSKVPTFSVEDLIWVGFSTASSNHTLPLLSMCLPVASASSLPPSKSLTS